MFTSTYENILAKKEFDELYKNWLESSEDNKETGGYLNGNFFQWLGLQYRDKDKYKVPFYYAIDLLIRKNITSFKFIQYDDEYKTEFYSNAIYKVNKYLFESYNESKGNLFIYCTSTITSAFWDVIRDKKKQDEIKKKLSNEMRGEYDMLEIDKEQNSIFEEVYNRLDNDIRLVEIETTNEDGEIEVKYKELRTIIEENTKELLRPFTLNKEYVLKHNLKLLEDKSVPKFKRKYLTFQNIIEFKDSKERTENKGVIIEYVDTRLYNEDMGTKSSYFFKQSWVSRINGYQYFLVFNDMWTKELKEIVKEKLNNLILQTKWNDGEYSNEENTKQLQFDYILMKDLKEENIIPHFYWGLHDLRDKREVIMYNTIEAFEEYKQSVENATRVYGCGRIKLKD